MNVIELARELEVKRLEYKRKWDAYPTKSMADGQQAKDIPANDLEGLRTLMAEINELSTKHEELVKFESDQASFEAKFADFGRPVNRVLASNGGDLGELLFASSAWQNRVSGKFSEEQSLAEQHWRFCRQRRQ